MSGSATVQVGGLRWQPAQTLQSIGIQSLVSKILCESHNAELSPLDAVAGTLFRALNAADKAPTTLPAVTQIEGPLIERWFLKVLCGLIVASEFGDGIVPDRWKALLLGAEWPDHWGLYLPVPSSAAVLAKELDIKTHANPATSEILAASFSVAGVSLRTVLGRPDSPLAWGLHRPRGLIFNNEAGEKRVEFLWPHVREQAVTYTKVGSTKERPPQWAGWKE